jgi:hypothetical protein
MNIQELAQLMGQKESDVKSFVECLKVWIEKGFTIEQAIEKHMSQMTRLAEHSHQISTDVVVETFFPA